MAGVYVVWYHDEGKRLHRINWWYDGETAFRMVESYAKLGYEPWLEWMILPIEDKPEREVSSAHQETPLIKEGEANDHRGIASDSQRASR